MSWKYAETALKNLINLNLSERKIFKKKKIKSGDSRNHEIHFIFNPLITVL